METHGHGAADGSMLLESVILSLLALALLMYTVGVLIGARRGRRWPPYRTMLWCLGLAAAASGFVGPIAGAAHESFTDHMAAHLMVGMVAPLLLVLAAPATLALRSLSVVPARTLSRLLRSPFARVFTNPVVAAVLNIGGAWALYATPLYEFVQSNPPLHPPVMLHFLIAGYLYTASLVPRDPAPHRASFRLRSCVLVLSIAAHGVLAKLLYAQPAEGVAIADAHRGSQLMYYGGDLVDFVLAVLLCAQWYRAANRAERAPAVRASGTSAGLKVEPAP